MPEHTSTDTVIHEQDHVHEWFGFTYAQYAVLNRTVLQSMPAEWQKRFVRCMRELDHAASEVGDVEYKVEPGEWQYPDDVPADVLKRLGWKWNRKARREIFDPEGNPHNAGTACVFVPCANPIPPYERGRARVELLPLDGFKAETDL